MTTGLASRPQNKKPEPDGSSRYDAQGTLWIKHGGVWMTFGRFSAVKFLARNGIRLPQNVRVEVIDATRPVAVHNLTLKFRGRRERVRLIDLAREMRIVGHTSRK